MQDANLEFPSTKMPIEVLFGRCKKYNERGDVWKKK